MNWRLFALLWVAGLIAGLGLAPMFGAMETGISWGVAAIVVVVAGGVVLALSIFIGLRFGPRLGLGAPILEARLAGGRCEDAANRLLTGVGLGVLMGAVGIGVALLTADSIVTEGTDTQPFPTWAGLAMSVAAGIDEEIIFRLGLMTLIVWLMARMLPGEDGRARAAGMWIAVVISAVIFAASHPPPPGLDVFGAALPLATVRLVTAVILGWLYWRRGLESAMCAHFAYDIIVFYGIVAAV